MKSLLEYIIKSDGHRLSQDSNSMRGKGASFPSVEIIKRHRFISDGLRRSKIFYKNHISSRPFFFTLNLKEFMPHHYCILATVPRNFYTFYVFKKKRKIRAGITVPKCFKIPNKNTYSYEKTTGLRSLIELNKKQALYWQKGHLEDCGVCFLFLPVLFRVKDAPEILIFFLPKWICNILEMTFSNSKERLRLGGTYLRGKVSCFLWQGLVWKII